MNANLQQMRFEATNACIVMVKQYFAFWTLAVERGALPKTTLYARCAEIMQKMPARVNSVCSARMIEDHLDFVAESADEALQQMQKL